MIRSVLTSFDLIFRSYWTDRDFINLSSIYEVELDVGLNIVEGVTWDLLNFGRNLDFVFNLIF